MLSLYTMPFYIRDLSICGFWYLLVGRWVGVPKDTEGQPYFKITEILAFKSKLWGFPSGAVVESPPANAGDLGSGPGLGGSHMPRSN